MDSTRYLVTLYALFWIVRINGCVRRGRQPLLRGREWFFQVHVPPGFYEGPGKRFLHRYWMRMLLPFAVDIPAAIAIFMSGHLLLLACLILGLSALIHINHLYSVDLAERQARAFAVAEPEQPQVRVCSSLEPRRLRDYTSAKVEWALGLAALMSLVLLIRFTRSSPGPLDLRLVFGIPAALFYLQLGFLFAKKLVVAWRAPAPMSGADEHIRAREETRKYYLRVCDWQRAALTTAILFWPLLLNTPREELGRRLNLWFLAWLAVGIVSTVWIEIRRKKLVALSLQARPVAMPDLLGQAGMARWPLCYQPSAPMMILKGARGYSLNLASRLTHIGAAYVAGFVVLAFLLPMHH